MVMHIIIYILYTMISLDNQWFILSIDTSMGFSVCVNVYKTEWQSRVGILIDNIQYSIQYNIVYRRIIRIHKLLEYTNSYTLTASWGTEFLVIQTFDCECSCFMYRSTTTESGWSLDTQGKRCWFTYMI